MAEEEELEQLKQQRLLELRKRAAEEEARNRAEAEKHAALRVVLTPEARQRLANIRMARPEFAEQLEMQLIQLAQAGRLQIPVTDNQLKDVLDKLIVRKRDINIRRY